MLDPCPQPCKGTEIAAKKTLHTAMNNCGGITPHGPEHRNHVAADLRMGSEFDVADDRDRVAVNLAVDIGSTQDGNRVRLYGPGHPGIAKDRNHVHRVALVG